MKLKKKVTKSTILIVEDNCLYRESLKLILDTRYNLLEAGTRQQAIRLLFEKNNHIDLILLDLNLPDSRGSESVSRVIQQFPEIPVIVLTIEADPHIAADVIKRGACDYILKRGIHDNSTSLLKKIESALSQFCYPNKKTGGDKNYFFPHHPVYESLYAKASLAIKESLCLFIQGETGAGKSMLVKHLHRTYAPHVPLITLDCGAIPESLLDSELFGHTKGAFTNAITEKKGLIEEADGGILFLDEISNSSIQVQEKLLYVLDEKKVKRIGENRAKSLNFTLVTASNKKMSAQVKAGKFRSDLFFRIKEVEIEIPPLRDNPDVLRQYLEYFLNIYNEKCNTDFVPNPPLYKALLTGEWRGNIRELEREVKRFIYFNQYKIPYIFFPDENDAIESPETNSRKQQTYFARRDQEERDEIMSALKRNNWNVSRTAIDIHINRNTLNSRLKILGINVKELKKFQQNE